MDLYITLSGTLAILISFGVFEKFLKINNINRWFAFLFLTASCVLYIIGDVVIFNIKINLCTLIYAVFVGVLFTRQKSVKNYISLIFVSLLVIAVLTFYNALNLSDFEFDFIQPYVYVAIFAGILFNYTCLTFKSAFCGIFLGGLTFEILFYNLSLSYTSQNLIIGSEMILNFTLISSVVYCVFNSLVQIVKSFKDRKKDQKVKI